MNTVLHGIVFYTKTTKTDYCSSESITQITITQSLPHSMRDAIMQCKMKNLYNIICEEWRST